MQLAASDGRCAFVFEDDAEQEGFMDILRNYLDSLPPASPERSCVMRALSRFETGRLSFEFQTDGALLVSLFVGLLCSWSVLDACVPELDEKSASLEARVERLEVQVDLYRSLIHDLNGLTGRMERLIDDLVDEVKHVGRARYA